MFFFEGANGRTANGLVLCVGAVLPVARTCETFEPSTE